MGEEGVRKMNKQMFKNGSWHHEAVTWRLVFCGSEREQIEMREMKNQKQTQKRKHPSDLTDQYNRILIDDLKRKQKLFNTAMRLDRNHKVDCAREQSQS